MTILDYCISLNSVQNVLVVLGVVDMCHLLLNDFDCKPEAIGMEPFLCLDRLFIMRKFFVMWEGGLKRL